MIGRRHAALIATLACLSTTIQHQANNLENPQQWHLKYLHTSKAHEISKGEGISVAVIDSGVADHPDLEGSTLPGISFIPGGNHDGRIDEQGHGTAMAGLIAAHGVTISGATGVAPRAKILPIRILDASGKGDSNNTASAIAWAVSHGARIINISSGGGPNPAVRESIENAIKNGVIVIASAGNRPRDNVIQFPAYIDGVIAVGATDKSGRISDSSVTGQRLELSAPGTEIFSTGLGGSYRIGTGTSDAAAIVSGVAALVWSRYPELSAAEVVHRMTATAVDKGAPGRDPEYGFGIVDPVAALTADVPPLEPSAQPAPTSAAGDPAHAPNTMGQIAVILIATIASLLAVALAITLLVFRLRSQNRRNRTELPDGDDT